MHLYSPAQLNEKIINDNPCMLKSRQQHRMDLKHIFQSYNGVSSQH